MEVLVEVGVLVAVGGTEVAVGVTGVFVTTEVDVLVATGVGVLVASVTVGVLVRVLETTITTVTLSPKPVLVSSTSLQNPLYVPAVVGAVRDTDNCTCFEGATDAVRLVDAPPIRSPLTKTSLKVVSQVQVPVFCNAQVLTKISPGVMTVLSGMVTSLT